MTDLVVPAFWDLHRSPPEFLCWQSSPVCSLGADGKLGWEWACGRFSSVRAKRDLALCLEHVGLTELAGKSLRMRAGTVEALIWDEMLAAGKDTARWLELQRVRDVARRIRKPINDACDYEMERDKCLSQ